MKSLFFSAALLFVALTFSMLMEGGNHDNHFSYGVYANATNATNTTMAANTTATNTTMAANTTASNSTMASNTTMDPNTTTIMTNTTQDPNMTTMAPNTTGNWTEPANWTMGPNETWPPGNGSGNGTWPPPPPSGNSSASNTTAAPTNASQTMAPNTTMTPPTAPPTPTGPPHCNTFQYHVNCAAQQHCEEYNMTCVPKCSMADANATKCDMWPHCWTLMGKQGDPSTDKCKTKCGGLSRDACYGSAECTFYNDQCGNFCKDYGKDMTKCNNDKKCMYDDVNMMCKPHCNWAHDELTCIGIMGDEECRWDMASMKCEHSCYELKGTACTSMNECQLLGAGTSWEYCDRKCSSIMDWNSCANEAHHCDWSNGACRLSCGRVDTMNDCTANPICGWNDVSKMCYTKNCSAFGTDVNACGSYANSGYCVVGPNKTCMNSCSNKPMPITNTSCEADQHCWWNATTIGCYDKPCSHIQNDNDCSFRRACQWTATAGCVPNCNMASHDWAKCDSWSHCTWKSDKCLPKCDMQTTKYSCLGANNMWFASINYGPCFWSEFTGCTNYKCSDYEYNSTKCSAATGCVDRRDGVYDTCLPSCGRALTKMDCMSPFFQAAKGCFWDMSTDMCKVNCEYVADMQSCTGHCEWSSNFSVCVHKKMMMTTSTMATSSTAEPTTSTAMASTSTEAPTTTQQQQTSTSQAQQQSTSTTAAGQQATTTEAPTPTKKRNPRVQFVLTAVARARANTTAANFKTLLAQMLSIPANTMEVTYDQSTGAMLVEFKEDATDASGNPVNATAEFEKAVTLDSADLSSLGAASVTSAEPAPAPSDAPADDGPNIPLIAGAAAGGFLFLVIILVVIKKQTSGGTGAYLEDDKPGDRPMLEVPQQQGRNNANML